MSTPAPRISPEGSGEYLLPSRLGTAQVHTKFKFSQDIHLPWEKSNA
eukprot:SAG31_NODE_36674_length_311_cov_0.839623_1_plen_46_part_01